MEDMQDSNEKKLFSGILRLNTRILGLALGLIMGLGIFIMTNWLVIKGGIYLRVVSMLLVQI